MTCREVEELLHPYCDGELDLVRHVQVEEHLAECRQCAKQAEELRRLRSVVSSAAPYYRAPASLRAKIQSQSTSESSPLGRGPGEGDATEGNPAAGKQPILDISPIDDRRLRLVPRLVAIAAGILLIIGAATMLRPHLFPPGPAADDQLAALVVASHVRSLQVEHLIDVVSSDKHTVKPWFRGKLDFSPSVPDLSKEGYPLTGGRLDYLADRPVAALVYARRAHVINVFIWPAPNDEEAAVRSFARQGFHVRAWQRGGMTYWTISDLNDQDLDQFVRLFRDRDSDTAP